MPHLAGTAGDAPAVGDNRLVTAEREDDLNLRILTICTVVSVAAHIALLMLALPPVKVESGHHERVEVGLITPSVQDRFSTPQAAAGGPRPETPGEPRPPAAPLPLPAIPPPPTPFAPDLTAAMARAAEQLPAPPPTPKSTATPPRKFEISTAAGRSNHHAEKQSESGFSAAATAPQAASNPPPAYPQQAREQGWSGSVWLQIRIGSNGRVETVRLEQSSGYPLLDETAIEAVRNWNFEPARQAGRAVATTVRVPIRFRLEDD